MQERSEPPPRRRRLRGDGTIRIRVGGFEVGKHGASTYDWHDPYHFAIALNWRNFALLFLCLNLGINVVFATLYLVQPGSVANARPWVFSDAFFFSMETLATVGYGAMSPATFYGHVVAATEIIIGMAFTAIMTGLTFVRFSRPRAKMLFAEKAVVANYNGRPTLMIRIANGRASLLADATARLTALVSERSSEGQFYRRVRDLKLARARNPMFALTWTLMHAIDEKSPLHGYSAQTFSESDMRLFLAVEARDMTLNATVYDMKGYRPADVAFGMRYAEAVSIDAAGRAIADLDRISILEPDAGTNFSPEYGEPPAESPPA